MGLAGKRNSRSRKGRGTPCYPSGDKNGGSPPKLVGKKYGFLFSVSSKLQSSAGNPVNEGVAVSAGRGVGKGRWQPGKAVVRSPLSRDRVGFRWTRGGSIDTCLCRDSLKTNGCRATGIPRGGKPLEPDRPRSRWRQILATPEPLRGSPSNAPLGSPRLTRRAPANREEEPVRWNSVPKKHTGNLSENLLPMRILRSSNVRCYPRILVRNQYCLPHSAYPVLILRTNSGRSFDAVRSENGKWTRTTCPAANAPMRRPPRRDSSLLPVQVRLRVPRLVWSALPQESSPGAVAETTHALARPAALRHSVR